MIKGAGDERALCKAFRIFKNRRGDLSLRGWGYEWGYIKAEKQDADSYLQTLRRRIDEQFFDLTDATERKIFFAVKDPTVTACSLKNNFASSPRSILERYKIIQIKDCRKEWIASFRQFLFGFDMLK